MASTPPRPPRNQGRQRFPHHLVLRFARATEQRALEASTRAAQASAVTCYVRECHHWQIAPWPVSYNNFAAYIHWYCYTGGSARSVKTIKSHLHHYSQAKGLSRPPTHSTSACSRRRS